MSERLRVGDYLSGIEDSRRRELVWGMVREPPVAAVWPWYRQYGVGECWLIDPGRRTVTVVDLSQKGRRAVRRFAGAQPVRSSVLRDLCTRAEAFFD